MDFNPGAVYYTKTVDEVSKTRAEGDPHTTDTAHSMREYAIHLPESKRQKRPNDCATIRLTPETLEKLSGKNPRPSATDLLHKPTVNVRDIPHPVTSDHLVATVKVPPLNLNRLADPSSVPPAGRSDHLAVTVKDVDHPAVPPPIPRFGTSDHSAATVDKDFSANHILTHRTSSTEIPSIENITDDLLDTATDENDSDEEQESATEEAREKEEGSHTTDTDEKTKKKLLVRAKRKALKTIGLMDRSKGYWIKQANKMKEDANKFDEEANIMEETAKNIEKDANNITMERDANKMRDKVKQLRKNAKELKEKAVERKEEANKIEGAISKER